LAIIGGYDTHDIRLGGLIIKGAYRESCSSRLCRDNPARDGRGLPKEQYLRRLGLGGEGQSENEKGILENEVSLFLAGKTNCSSCRECGFPSSALFLHRLET
jgi:hypothetical protein